MVELLSSSLKSDKIKLVHKIALQAGEKLTPTLINAIHTQRKEIYPDISLEEITNSISTIISGSNSLDLTCVFVSIYNGQGIFRSVLTWCLSIRKICFLESRSNRTIRLLIYSLQLESV